MLRTLKKNRSNIYTKGLSCTIQDSNLRFPFFEIDLDHSVWLETVIHHYNKHKLDVLIHRTGKGWHFLSPTLITKEEWREFHKPIKHINPTCPMTTLRMLPNKYPNEMEIWCNNVYYSHNNRNINSEELCNILNKTFNSHLKGDYKTKLIFVMYPLPL